MPLVQIKGVGGYLSPGQKKELISRVTDAVVSVEGEKLRSVTWVKRLIGAAQSASAPTRASVSISPLLVIPKSAASLSWPDGP